MAPEATKRSRGLKRLMKQAERVAGRPAVDLGIRASVAELMDPAYQAAAFFGGPSGPNYPSPRDLLDIPGWQSMGKGEAAQAVEVSAYPDRYNNYEPVAENILTNLTSGTSTSSTTAPSPAYGICQGE